MSSCFYFDRTYSLSIFLPWFTVPQAAEVAEGRTLRFLANVDPVDVARATKGLNPEETLVVVVSKTFTTAETMLNARTLRKWLLDGVKGTAPEEVIRRHMVAASSAVPLVTEFGIDSANVFGFWDWVGGRYSVCSAVGMLPLSLTFGFEVLEQFLAGARNIDEHFATAPIRQNIPVLMGLLGIWNSTFLGHESRAILPYAQALLRFPAHVQQLDMESNGKRVGLDGQELPFQAGEVNFGEPGTNGQHSFYQLIHQGRTIPTEFIGFARSQYPVELPNEVVSSQDELMSNFFAQPDALALGKTLEQLDVEGVKEELRPHKAFPGNRPSFSLLFGQLDPFTTGQLLALYEHRVFVQGAIWGINSFDQWGVELGKVLAKQVRTQLTASRQGEEIISGFNSSTAAMLNFYLSNSSESSGSAV
jgi:glucose-6-phosphate isomerase